RTGRHQDGRLVASRAGPGWRAAGAAGRRRGRPGPSPAAGAPRTGPGSMPVTCGGDLWRFGEDLAQPWMVAQVDAVGLDEPNPFAQEPGGEQLVGDLV